MNFVPRRFSVLNQKRRLGATPDEVRIAIEVPSNFQAYLTRSLTVEREAMFCGILRSLSMNLAITQKRFPEWRAGFEFTKAFALKGRTVCVGEARIEQG